MPVRTIRMEINGQEEIEAQLARAPMNLRRMLLKDAIKEAAKRVAQEVRKEAPMSYEPDPSPVTDIRRQVRHRVIEDGFQVIGKAFVTKKAFWAPIVEFGHEKKGETGWVLGDAFFRRSADRTLPFLKSLIIGKLRKSVSKVVK